MMKSTIPRCYRDRARRVFPAALATGEQRACLPNTIDETPLRTSLRVVSDRVSRLKPLSPAWAKKTQSRRGQTGRPVHRQHPVDADSLAG